MPVMLPFLIFNKGGLFTYVLLRKTHFTARAKKRNNSRTHQKKVRFNEHHEKGPKRGPKLTTNLSIRVN
jgi:hypothetical protein